MRKIFFAILVNLIPLWAAFAADPSQEASPGAVAVTDPAEITAILNDLTIYAQYIDGTKWIEYHRTNGRSAYFENGCTSPGAWWVDGQEICYSYPNYRNGAPNCFFLFRIPDGLQFVSVDETGDAQLTSYSTKITQGNTENLPLSDSVQCLSI